jgi:hypothetical protein
MDAPWENGPDIDRDAYDRHGALVAIIDKLIARGEFPSGARIQKELGRNHSALNSEQTKWRRQYLTSLGWTRGPNLRDQWKAPT